MKYRAFWDIIPCSQFDVERRFRGAWCENLKSHI
jgi:hypothetical protein